MWVTRGIPEEDVGFHMTTCRNDRSAERCTVSGGNEGMDLLIMRSSVDVNLQGNDRQLWLSPGHLEKLCEREGAGFTFVVLVSFEDTKSKP